MGRYEMLNYIKFVTNTNTVEIKWRSICMTSGNLRVAVYAS